MAQSSDKPASERTGAHSPGTSGSHPRIRPGADTGEYEMNRGRNVIADHEPKEEGAIPMRQLVIVATVLLAAACGRSPAPPGTPAAEPSQAVQLGGPPSGAGTVTAD